ncbi:MAG TPA: trehalose-phosphatase [bacterium]|nr:trehalose-phosphatase [bacterium]
MKKNKSPFIIPASRSLLFLLDYDGTLTDFKNDPNHSRLVPATRAVLYQLRKKHAVVIVTGRYVAALTRLSGLKNFPIIGTHGFEARNLPGGLRFASLSQEKRYHREAAAIWKAVKNLHRAYPGIHIEEKPFSSTLHYRGAHLSPTTIKKLEKEYIHLCRKSVTAGLWSFQSGKSMVEVMPKGFSKGRSVRKLLKKLPNHFAVSAGDDIADISVFKALGKNGLKVAVGSRIPRKYYDVKFKTPRQLTAWLKKLV